MIEQLDYTRTHDLTIEEIKGCTAFKHLTDEQAQEVVNTLKLFTKITFENYEKQLKKS